MLNGLYLAIVVISFIFSGGCCRRVHPSDAILIHRFNRNEADFDHLLAMAREDRGLNRVDNDWTDPSDPSAIGVSAERIDEYRRLFAKLGVPRGLYAYGDPPTQEFQFLASTYGFCVAGSCKGYAYLGYRPKLIVDNLETSEILNQSSKFEAYRHIKGNWFLFKHVY